MTHKIVFIDTCDVVGPYKLRIRFTDSKTQEVDLSNILYGELFGPLKTLDFFNQVKVDPEAKTIVWPNGADFDPAILYEWEKYKDEFLKMARMWQ